MITSASAHPTSIATDDEVYWVPPYWEPVIEGYEGKVVDPTGAGNAFMGGLAAALDDGRDLHEGDPC